MINLNKIVSSAKATKNIQVSLASQRGESVLEFTLLVNGVTVGNSCNVYWGDHEKTMCFVDKCISSIIEFVDGAGRESSPSC
jgi:hypothetical protein